MTATTDGDHRLFSLIHSLRLLKVKGQSHEIVQDVKKRMLESLHAREDIASRVHSYRIEGRTKGLVSTFRKVGDRGHICRPLF